MRTLFVLVAIPLAACLSAKGANSLTPSDQLSEIIAKCQQPETPQNDCELNLWKFADVTGDGELTSAEIARFGRVLTASDRSKAEQTAPKKQERAEAYAFLLSPLLATFALAHWDYDGNGSISRTELYYDVEQGGFREFMARLRGAGEAAWSEALNYPLLGKGLDVGGEPQGSTPPNPGKNPRLDMDRLIKSQQERASPRMTMSEIDTIRFQIQQCWSVPLEVRHAEDLQVQIRIFLNPDGSLAKAPQIVNSLRMQHDEFWRSAAESARRAVLKCSPLKNLPPEKYEHWREITLTFDPKEMLGG